MADLVDTSDWQKRYGGIENAYCQGRWAAVMENGTVLLRELLDAGGDPEVEALRHRIEEIERRLGRLEALHMSTTHLLQGPPLPSPDAPASPPAPPPAHAPGP